MQAVTRFSENSPARLAAQFINSTQRNIFLTGRAGTGKTTFLREIVGNTFKNVVVVAPTGIAAINAGGNTVHSMFQIPICSFLPTYDNSLAGDGAIHTAHSLLRQQRLGKSKQKLLRNLELLIIDEVSMLRADLLDAIDTVLKSVRRAHNRPFGGAQVLFIGDLLQLPPVVRDEDWRVLSNFYESPFFFHSHVLKDNPPVYIELEKIHRQSDIEFIGLLNNLRSNKVTKKDEELLNKHYKPGYYAVPVDDHIQLTTHNHKADTMNRDALRKLNSKSETFKATITGDFPASMYPVEESLELKIDAQVMFTRNDTSTKQEYYNGKIGRIMAINEKFIVVQCPSQPAIKVHRAEWENVRYITDPVTNRVEKDVIGTFTQFPVRLAWAITVHKSQGLTFSNAILDLEQAFAPGQVYVALSRLRSLEGLILSTKVNLNSLRQDQQVAAYSQRTPDEAALKTLLEKESRLFITDYVASCFDLKPLEQTFVQFIDDLPHDEEKSVRARFHKWPKKIVNDFQETLVMAGRFVAQVIHIGGDWNALQLRVDAAKKYFTPIINDLISKIDAHITTVREYKGVKQYIQDLEELKLAVIQQLRRYEQAELILASAIAQRTISKDELYAAEYFPYYGKREDGSQPFSVYEANPPKKKAKKKKGDSARLSYELLREGKTIPEIAIARDLTETTIYGHLAECVEQGLCAPEELIDPKRIETILLVSKQLGTMQLTPIRERLGETYSYNEIRIALAREVKAGRIATEDVLKVVN